jgi:hypothetical protein
VADQDSRHPSDVRLTASCRSARLDYLHGEHVRRDAKVVHQGLGVSSIMFFFCSSVRPSAKKTCTSGMSMLPRPANVVAADAATRHPAAAE